jgi:hypothetical protein
MRATTSTTLALSFLALTACGVADSDGPAVAPELGDGKSDAIDQVEDRGALAFGTAANGSFGEDLQFDGYHLSVRDGARVRIEITQAGTAKKLDTTLFVYGPVQDGAFGTSAIAFDDDSGWGRQSRLSSLELDGGEYLVVVGTHDARGRGKYRLLGTCLSGECEPLPEIGGCNELIANNILNCVGIQVADTQADPETPDLTRAEALEICTDAEALGPVFDNICLGPQPQDFCAAGFQAFAESQSPACREELAPFAVECVFGDEYRDLETSSDVIRGRHRTISSPVGLGDIERAQVIAAVRSSAADHVTTIEQAFDAADEGEINVTELWDRTSARAYVAYEFGAGDTSVGAYFAHGTDERVAVISDGFLERCSAAVGPQGEDCSTHADCGVGFCFGRSEAFDVGRCIVTAGFGDQHDCSDMADCDVGEGLMCAMLTRSETGQCFPAWMRGNFTEQELDAAIPDGDAEGVSRTMMVHGLATVDTDVELDLRIEHPSRGQLRVTLANPAGTEVVVFDGESDGSSLSIEAQALGFSGDESVNGPWTLRVVDDTAGQAGSLAYWTLHLGSRFD